MVHEIKRKEKKKMNKNNLIKEITILSILILPVIFMLMVWNLLPDKLPVHWNISGEIDSYGPNYVIPLLNTGLYLLLLLIPKIDPRKNNYTIFSSTYYKLRIILTLFFSILLILIIYDAIYSKVDFGKLMPAGFMFLFALLGNFMATIRPNYFLGVRTPWTLNNDEVWRRTHYMAGKLWFYLGIISGLLIIFLDKKTGQYFAVTVLAVILVVPVVYSYIQYSKLNTNSKLHS